MFVTDLEYEAAHPRAGRQHEQDMREEHEVPLALLLTRGERKKKITCLVRMSGSDQRFNELQRKVASVWIIIRRYDPQEWCIPFLWFEQFFLFGHSVISPNSVTSRFVTHRSCSRNRSTAKVENPSDQTWKRFDPPCFLQSFNLSSFL